MGFLELAQDFASQGDEFIARHGTDEFHKCASELLSKSDFHKVFDINEVIIQFFNEKNLNNQKYTQLEFSDLPMTISRGENCFIDVYFWRRRPTVIHNHHFAGAFMCLQGLNLDYEYLFTGERVIGAFHELGKLEVKRKKELKAGDLVAIAPMDGFIHQNFHHSDLTINLCFRTLDLKEVNLSNYLSTGLRFEKDSHLLLRTAYLRRFLDFNEIRLDDLDISTDEALNFLLEYSDTGLRNQRLNKILTELNIRIHNEHGVDIQKSLEETYNELFENEC